MMNRDDLVAEYDKISNEINVLSKRKLAVKDELLKLSEEEYDSVCAKWQQFVGKCFKKECATYPKYSQYFIIIDVPNNTRPIVVRLNVKIVYYRRRQLHRARFRPVRHLI